MSYQNNKQCAESIVDSYPYKVCNGEIICAEFEDLYQKIYCGGTYSPTAFLDNFPLKDYAENDEELVSYAIQKSSSPKYAYTQPSSYDQFFPQLLDSSESEQPSQEQATWETQPKTKSRSIKDGHVLSQNLGSKARSLVCKMMSKNKPKSFKKQIKELYTKFLKENGFSNSQVALLFSYLFLMKNRVPRMIYSEFRHDFLKHLYAKKAQARQKPDQEVSDGLIAKINVNIRLADYLFSLRDPWDLDFMQAKTVCEPLFTGRQAKVIEKPLKKAQLIYDEIILSIIKTSNTSTGCQVQI